MEYKLLREKSKDLSVVTTRIDSAVRKMFLLAALCVSQPNCWVVVIIAARFRISVGELYVLRFYRAMKGRLQGLRWSQQESAAFSHPCLCS